MNIFQALDAMANRQKVRNENFAAGTYCVMDRNGYIDDPELGIISEREFINEYKDFEKDWYIYE